MANDADLFSTVEQNRNALFRMRATGRALIVWGVAGASWVLAGLKLNLAENCVGEVGVVTALGIPVTGMTDQMVYLVFIAVIGFRLSQFAILEEEIDGYDKFVESNLLASVKSVIHNVVDEPKEFVFQMLKKGRKNITDKERNRLLSLEKEFRLRDDGLETFLTVEDYYEARRLEQSRRFFLEWIFPLAVGISALILISVKALESLF